MDGPSVFATCVVIIILGFFCSMAYNIGKDSVRSHIAVYGCEKTISVYNIEMEKKK